MCSFPERSPAAELALDDVELSLETDRGVFAVGRIDFGTRQLLQIAPPPPRRGNLLDLGAGYGPIAIALARLSPRARFWAVDINQRAVELTRVNAFARSKLVHDLSIVASN